MMLNRSWRLILLLIALVFLFWDLIPGYSLLVAEIAVVILLVNEFMCKGNCASGKSSKKKK